MTFGTFISTRRKELKQNLRDTAKYLKIAYGYDGNSSTDESNGIIERQADAMATALLMPLPQVKKCFYRLRSGRSTEQLIYEMSQIFAVSKQATLP